MTKKDITPKKGVKREKRFGGGSGSQLRVSITVSHHSDWRLTVFATFQTLPRRQTWKLNTSSALDPTLSFLQLTLFPSQTSATLLPAFQWLYSHQGTSTGGGEMVYKCTLCVVVSNTAWWGQTHTATSWMWDPAPCWRRTGLLHLLWEADWRGER